MKRALAVSMMLTMLFGSFVSLSEASPRRQHRGQNSYYTDSDRKMFRDMYEHNKRHEKIAARRINYAFDQYEKALENQRKQNEKALENQKNQQQ
jgi:hypothetical protein